MTVKKHKGFTLIELLVVIAIIALLVSILLPSLNRARELAKRTICGTQLKSIGNALATYNTEHQSYPFLVTGESGVKAVDDTTAGVSDPEDLTGDDPTVALNPVEDLNLLVASGQVGFKMFRCPAVGNDVADRTDGQTEYGFKVDGVQYIDYAYHWGRRYNGATSDTNPAYLSDRLNSGLVIIGDAPGSDGDPAADDFGDENFDNWNHGDSGVNVLTMGASASWETTIKCGTGDDNIYTSEGTTYPDDDSDTVLMAADEDGA